MLKVSKILVAQHLKAGISTSTIDPSTPYYVVDTHTGKIVGKYTWKSRNQARAFQDKKDLEYGAVRYVCKFGDDTKA